MTDEVAVHKIRSVVRKLDNGLPCAVADKTHLDSLAIVAGAGLCKWRCDVDSLAPVGAIVNIKG